MKLVLLAGLGSFAGGIFRYLATILVQQKFLSSYPLGTFIVNMVGCFLIGIMYGMAEKGAMNLQWRLFFMTGLLGGFTTFSSFSGETLALLRGGQYMIAITYAGLSVVLGVLATFAGLFIFKWLAL